MADSFDGVNLRGRLAIKVDVDTLEGFRQGVPALLDILADQGVQASFFLAQGPAAPYNLPPRPPPNPHIGSVEGGACSPDFHGQEKPIKGLGVGVWGSFS